MIWACIAGGPSLAFDDYADLKYARSQGWSLATCNMGFRVAPDAKIFHAFDRLWWERYADELFETINPDCELWCGNHWAHCRYGDRLKRANMIPEGGWSTTRGKVHYGETTGYQLPQIVGWQKPEVIVLLGYDCQHTGGKRHHHDDYPETCDCPVVRGIPQHNSTCKAMKNVPNIERQVKYFDTMAAQATVPIINCSRETALTCFTRMTVQDVHDAYTQAGKIRAAVC